MNKKEMDKINKILSNYNIETKNPDYTSRVFLDVLREIANAWDIITDEDKFEMYQAMKLIKK